MGAEFLLATRSADKLREITEISRSAGTVRFVTLRDLQIEPLPAEDDVEMFDTFAGNAIAKARYFAAVTGRPAIADDSGLMVDALDGRPGVRTKRFAADHGRTGANVDQENNELLLDLMRDIPDDRRGAQYVCAAAVVYPEGRVLSTIGTCRGKIARERVGTGGFGYDPLFYIPDLAATFAQLSPTRKNERSHRAIAFRALLSHLK